MKIEGSIRANLLAAIASARRLRDRPVHDDTLQYWDRLLDHARRACSAPGAESLADLVTELEAQVSLRRP